MKKTSVSFGGQKFSLGAGLHPRAQAQQLRRAAMIAERKGDMGRMKAATDFMRKLNTEHNLGYNVPAYTEKASPVSGLPSIGNKNFTPPPEPKPWVAPKLSDPAMQEEINKARERMLMSDKRPLKIRVSRVQAAEDRKNIQTGPRGGRYYVTENGRKVYV